MAVIPEVCSNHTDEVNKIKRSLIPENKLTAITNYMKLLSHPVRLQIVKMLSEKDICVCVIEKILKRSQPNISQHLTKLKDNKIIESYPCGKYTYYHLKDDRIREFIKNI